MLASRRAVIALVITALSLTVAAGSAAEANPRLHDRASSFAVIGDIPYGQEELARFPSVVEQINRDKAVDWVAHLGDIKSGSTVCSDTYFDQIRADFDGFAEPLVYTVGDNEWTDCHRPNNGGYDPLERLATIRRTFFDRPGFTLGRPMRVTSDATGGYPENVTFVRDRVAFASVHVVGSNNGLDPWTGNTTATPGQTAEVLGRTASVITEIRETFARARRDHLASVVVLTQADMFDPTVGDPQFADYYAFQPIVQTLVTQASSFDGPVYLLNGDSHVYHSDRPLQAGSTWLSFYGVAGRADNLTRVTVDGSSNAKDYLRVRIDPRSRDVLSWQKVPFG